MFQRRAIERRPSFCGNEVSLKRRTSFKKPNGGAVRRLRIQAIEESSWMPVELSRKALKRIAKEGAKESDLRNNLQGAIYKESFGEVIDEKLPKWENYERMSYSDFIKHIKTGTMKKVQVWQDSTYAFWPPGKNYFEGKRCICTTADGKEYYVEVKYENFCDVTTKAVTQCQKKTLVSYHQPPEVKAGAGSVENALYAAAGGVFLLGSIWLGIIKKSGIPVDQVEAMEFAQSRAQARKEGMTGVKFEDVAGLGGVVDDLKEVVSFLKDPTRFNMVGARPPKGVLLEGGPGCGKTLIAKAVAGEAGVPFYTMSGSEFVEVIVGVGAARVRDLFKRARVNAPCLIFVDEIDALGQKRAPAIMRGNEEREQTLNQLLTEMDGFTPETGVIFIGATNRADLLDPALMRPGRFDRKVRVLKPNTAGREAILRVHSRKINLSPEVDLAQLARDLPGLSGAELANVLNEAALAALRRPDNREQVETQDVYAAVDRVLQGSERKALPKRLPVVRRVACFEAGRAVVATLLGRAGGPIEPVDRVSIVPRGDELARTVFARGDDEMYTLATRTRLLARLQVMLAGRAAEEVMYGVPSTYSAEDMQDATTLARRLVNNYGLGPALELATFTEAPPRTGTSGVFGMWKKFSGQVEGMDAASTKGLRGPQPGHRTLEKSRQASNRLVLEAYQANVATLRQHKPALKAATEALLATDQIYGADLARLMDENPPLSFEESENQAGEAEYAVYEAEAPEYAC